MKVSTGLLQLLKKRHQQYMSLFLPCSLGIMRESTRSSCVSDECVERERRSVGCERMCFLCGHPEKAGFRLDQIEYEMIIITDVAVLPMRIIRRT